MPRFTPNPTEASGGLSNLPKDSYTLKVISAKGFKNKEGDKHGVRVGLEVISDGAQKGKKIYPAFYMHNDGGMNMTKAFQLAVTGYTVKQEDDWNAKFGSKDFGYDTDDGSVGNGWSELQGQIVSADLDVTVSKTDATTEFQSFKWRPYNP